MKSPGLEMGWLGLEIDFQVSRWVGSVSRFAKVIWAGAEIQNRSRDRKKGQKVPINSTFFCTETDFGVFFIF